MRKLRQILRWLEQNTPGWCAVGGHFVRYKNLYLVHMTNGRGVNTCAKCDQDKLHWGR